MTQSTRIAALGALGLVLLAMPTRAADPIRWSVSNNFGLLASEEAQTRFKAESEKYLACMKKAYSPGQCANGRNTFGLTEQPYPVRFQPKTLTYDAALLQPREGGATDHVAIDLSLDGAPAKARCDWTIGGRTQKNVACDGARGIVKLGDEVAVSVAQRGKARSAETTVNVRRVVIATFGDSFMSGEGNPHIRSKPLPVRAENWLEPRCHRSLLTASSLAAFRYAEQHPQTYVAYFNFACSGSTSAEGVLGAYDGIISSRMLDNLKGEGEQSVHFRGPKLPSQLDQAKQTLCNKQGCINPDVMFLSIGINSLKFSDTITELAKRGCDGKCLRSLEGRIKKGLDDLAGDGPGSLRTTYQTLSRTLSPKAAFAIEYPDATRDEKGGFCDQNALFPLLGKISIGGLGRIDAKENKWANDTMLEPLNATVGEAVKGVDGWQLITGSADATRRHGYCSKQAYFNSGQDAKGTSGTMHPNVVGHDAIAGLLKTALDRALTSERKAD